jgi:hypothetical protein
VINFFDYSGFFDFSYHEEILATGRFDLIGTIRTGEDYPPGDALLLSPATEVIFTFK